MSQLLYNKKNNHRKEGSMKITEIKLLESERKDDLFATTIGEIRGKFFRPSAVELTVEELREILKIMEPSPSPEPQPRDRE